MFEYTAHRTDSETDTQRDTTTREPYRPPQTTVAGGGACRLALGNDGCTCRSPLGTRKGSYRVGVVLSWQRARPSMHEALA